MKENSLSSGHRRRLREKFLKSGLKGFHDYEIVELLLTLGSPRRDCKPAAKEAIRRFKTLRGVMEAPSDELQKIQGIGPHNAFGIKLVQEVAREFLKQRIIDKPVYETSRDIFDYLYHAMRDLSKEVFKVIYLNSQNQIIEINDMFEGTITTSSVYPQEIMRAAIKNNAVSLIFVHNHPSGNPEPSTNDNTVTRDLVFAGRIMQVKVLDHIVIGENRYYSFAGEGLIEEYELDFMQLRSPRAAEARRARYRVRPTGPKPYPE